MGVVTRGGKRRRLPAEMRPSSSKDPAFIQACEQADIPRTARQESKWRNGYGAAAAAAGRSTRRARP